MPTLKVINMTARASSSLAYNDFLYLTSEAPLTDERMQASVLRDYVLSGVKTSSNSGLAQTSSAYAAANPEYELSVDASNLAIVTAATSDYILIQDVTDNSTKKALISDVVTGGDIEGVTAGTNLNGGGTSGTVTLNLDTTITGLTSVTSTDFVGDLTGDVTGNADTATALAGTLGVTSGGTGLTTVAKGSVLAANAADTLSVVSGVTNGHVLTYDSAADTVGWAAPGHITTIEGTSVLSTSETGTAKFLRIDGDNSSSWQIPPDTNTTYTAGDGLDLTGTTFSTDLMANGGLEITSTELSVAAGISQYDVAQFATSVVDDDFLRIDGTAVEGRSASEVLTDIGASPVAGSSSIVTVGTISSGTIEGEGGILSTGETGATKYLREDGDGTSSWQAVSGAGIGDVVGPSSAINNSVARFDTTSGDLIQDTGSYFTVSDTGNVVLDGDKNITPGDGSMIHVDTATLTDNVTSTSGTATKFTSNSFEGQTLAATNASVTTTDAATVYISGPTIAGTNETLTRTHALWVDSGNARFDGSIYSGTTEAINSSGLVTVANQSNITGVSTITSGAWTGTAIDGAYIDLEGTELKSTGETGGTKFLREDGDNSCSWQTVAAGATAGFAVAMAIAL